MKNIDYVKNKNITILGAGTSGKGASILANFLGANVLLSNNKKIEDSKRLNNNITETENVVFANITTMVPALYARNPKAEFTSTNSKYEKLAVSLEHLINTLMHRKVAPGVNLKPKAKRAVVTALLTNRAWLQLNWTFKQDSSEVALEELDGLANKLQKAKSVKEIEKVEKV